MGLVEWLSGTTEGPQFHPHLQKTKINFVFGGTFKNNKDILFPYLPVDHCTILLCK
jgi:hypothetical protein